MYGNQNGAFATSKPASVVVAVDTGDIGRFSDNAGLGVGSEEVILLNAQPCSGLSNSTNSD